MSVLAVSDVGFSTTKTNCSLFSLLLLFFRPLCDMYEDRKSAQQLASIEMLRAKRGTTRGPSKAETHGIEPEPDRDRLANHRAGRSNSTNDRFLRSSPAPPPRGMKNAARCEETPHSPRPSFTPCSLTTGHRGDVLERRRS